MKSDDEVTKVEKAFLRTKAELHLLGRLLRETVTLKLPWQYYAIGALLWADGMLAGWLISQIFSRARSSSRRARLSRYSVQSAVLLSSHLRT